MPLRKLYLCPSLQLAGKHHYFDILIMLVAAASAAADDDDDDVVVVVLMMLLGVQLRLLPLRLLVPMCTIIIQVEIITCNQMFINCAVVARCLAEKSHLQYVLYICIVINPPFIL